MNSLTAAAPTDYNKSESENKWESITTYSEEENYLRINSPPNPLIEVLCIAIFRKETINDSRPIRRRKARDVNLGEATRRSAQQPPPHAVVRRKPLQCRPPQLLLVVAI